MGKKKDKFPKRIAGVKLSKKMRKRAHSFAGFAQTPFGSALLAQTTVATIGSILKNDKVRQSAAEAGEKLRRMGMIAFGRAGHLVAAVRDAALDRPDTADESAKTPKVAPQRPDGGSRRGERPTGAARDEQGAPH